MLALKRSPRLTTLVFAAFCILLSAVMFPLPNLFYLLALLILTPLVSYFFAAAGLHSVSAERRLPPRLWPDEAAEVDLRITNRARWPKALLLIDERLPEGLEASPSQPPSCVAPMLWGEEFDYQYPVTARWRGRHVLPPVRATAIDAFDLLRASREVGPADRILVYPRTVPLEADVLTGLRQPVAASERRAADGTEFRHTREYRPGDDLRRIHWRSTARRGKPIVVDYEEPTSNNLYLLLDAEPQQVVGEGRDTTFETGVTLVASLIRHELEHGQAVGVRVDAEPAIDFGLTDDRHDELTIFERLGEVEPNAEQPLTQTLRSIAESMPRSALLMVVSAAPVAGQAPSELTTALAEVARRHVVAFAHLSPDGYAGATADQREAAGGFLAGLRQVGITTFSIRRGAIAESLRRPL